MDKLPRGDTARLLSVLTAVALVIIFTLQNRETLNVDFLFWEIEASRAIFLFLVFAIGLLSGWMMRGRGGSERSEPVSMADVDGESRDD